MINALRDECRDYSDREDQEPLPESDAMVMIIYQKLYIIIYFQQL